MKFICLLRAINVSGKNLIKMEYLRELFVQLNFTAIQTYIQSGNIVFDSEITDPTELNLIIESHFIKTFGNKIEAFIRNFQEWESISESNPFQNKLQDDSYKFYVTFFKTAPSAEMQQKLMVYQTEYEKYVFKERELYTIIKKDTGIKEIFSNNFVESKLKMPATTRNWNTIIKILDYKN